MALDRVADGAGARRHAATRSEPPATVRTRKLPSRAPLNRVHAGPPRPCRASWPCISSPRMVHPAACPHGIRAAANTPFADVSVIFGRARHFSDTYVTLGAEFTGSGSPDDGERAVVV